MRPRFHPAPDVLVITLRCAGDGQLGRFVASIAATGYGLRTAASYPVSEGLSVYDHVLTFTGSGRLGPVEQVIASTGGARLAGALDIRG
jgi:hypothetical protein